MGEEEKKEWEDLIVLDADPVEAVALTYDSERIPVKYQKIGGDAHTPRRGSAQAAGYDVYSAVNEEIPPEKTVNFPSNIITKPEPGWCLNYFCLMICQMICSRIHLRTCLLIWCSLHLYRIPEMNRLVRLFGFRSLFRSGRCIFPWLLLQRMFPY